VEASPGNVAPRILSRPEHNISRKNIDPDALKVLYRLKNNGFVAYLVGGGVRDLLLERRPKDFDIGTSAHPQQVRKLFKNCFIVGRRFRLAHVRFGRKVIEVSTFRRAAAPDEGEHLIRRDNTFGTPEEDAFRRDFTVNALFYDIANFSVIDWVGGLPDLGARVIRTIGDPVVRFREDPVRMLRAVALAARLDFTIDRDSVEAIRTLRGEIVRSSPARLVEELYKILRQGRARRSFELLHEHGLLAYLLPEADRAIAEGAVALASSLDRLDAHRQAGLATPEQLSNAVLMGSLLVPLGVPLRRVPVARPPRREAAGPEPEPGPEETSPAPPRDDVAAELAELEGAEGQDEPAEGEDAAEAPPLPLLLPFARRDLERLRLILLAQRRLREAHGPASARMIATKSYFEDAVRWLEIHGGDEGREFGGQWRELASRLDELPPDPAGRPEPETVPAAGRAEGNGSRRRRRRRRRRPRPEPPPPA
jgi:poly(A) polymerase